MGFVNNNIKKYRELKKLNQTQFADLVGLLPSDISRVESGKTKYIHDEIMQYLHNQGVNLNWFYSENNDHIPLYNNSNNTNESTISDNEKMYPSMYPFMSPLAEKPKRNAQNNVLNEPQEEYPSSRIQNINLELYEELLKSKDELIKSKDEVIKGKDEALKAKEEVLQSKEVVINALRGQLRQIEEQLYALQQTNRNVG